MTSNTWWNGASSPELCKQANDVMMQVSYLFKVAISSHRIPPVPTTHAAKMLWCQGDGCQAECACV